MAGYLDAAIRGYYDEYLGEVVESFSEVRELETNTIRIFEL